MKKLIFLIAILFVGMTAFAQQGAVKTVASDTVFSTNTVNFSIGTFSGSYSSLAIIAKTSTVGDSCAGTVALYGSLDGTNWVLINGVGGGVVTASPQASLTGTDLNQLTFSNGLIESWVIKGMPYNQYRVAAVGSVANDSTLVSIKYVYK